MKLIKTRLSKMAQLGGSKPILELRIKLTEEYMKNKDKPRSEKDLFQLFACKGDAKASENTSKMLGSGITLIKNEIRDM